MICEAKKCKIYNIFDFMCGTINDVLFELGDKVIHDELFYASLFDKLDGNKSAQNKNNKKWLSFQAKIKNKTDFDEAILQEKRAKLSAKFVKITELVATDNLIVWVVAIGKIECLLIDNFAKDCELVLFKKYNFCKSEEYLTDYIIANIPFCSNNKHIFAITQNDSFVETLNDRNGICIHTIGMDWLFSVKKYVEDMEFVQSKFVPIIKGILHNNLKNITGNLGRNIAPCAVDFNYFKHTLNYFRCMSNFQKD